MTGVLNPITGQAGYENNPGGIGHHAEHVVEGVAEECAGGPEDFDLLV